MYTKYVFLIIIPDKDQGPHIYQTCPSANYFDCKAMAIGSRSQSARTYLEKHLNEFLSCDLDELVKHGLRALRDTLPNEVDLSVKVSMFDIAYILLKCSFPKRAILLSLHAPSFITFNFPMNFL